MRPYVLITSHMHFRVNLHSAVDWMSRNSLLETGERSENQVTATRLNPQPLSSVNQNEHSTI